MVKVSHAHLKRENYLAPKVLSGVQDVLQNLWLLISSVFYLSIVHDRVTIVKLNLLQIQTKGNKTRNKIN